MSEPTIGADVAVLDCRSGSGVAALSSTATSTNWTKLFGISRPVAGYVEVVSIDANAAIKYRHKTPGATWESLYTIGPSTSTIIPVAAGAVYLECRADPSASPFDDLAGWYDTSGSATPRLQVRWSATTPSVPDSLDIISSDSDTADWTLGPRKVAVGGSTYFRPPRTLRRAVIRTAGAATITTRVLNSTAISTSVTSTNGGPVVIECGPATEIQVTNNEAATLSLSVTWLPSGGS